MKLSVFGLVYLISAMSWAQVSIAQKQDWIQRLNAGADGISIMAEYQRAYPDATFVLPAKPELTILSFHSYSLTPKTTTDNAQFINHIAGLRNANVVAPVATGHHSSATAQDYLDMKPEDWFVDAELGLAMAKSLGKKVVVQGFSMGGMFGLYLAQKYPTAIDRIVISAPALMIKHRVEDSACIAGSSLVKGLVKSVINQDADYLEKYLNGTCTLSKFTQKVRSVAPIQYYSNTETGQPTSEERYYAKLGQVQTWAKMIKVPVMLIYSESDEAVDLKATEEFAKGLTNKKVIVYKEVGHLQMMYNNYGDQAPSGQFEAMDQFIFGRSAKASGQTSARTSGQW